MTSEKPSESIRNERDIANILTSKWNIGGSGDCYFGVNRISKDLKVSPDIDLLRVYVNQWQPQENRAIGFELKVLKPRRYRDENWRIGLDPLYQGLGQVLTYFEHGIDKAALILGFHNDCKLHPNEVKEPEELLKKHCVFLRETVFANFPYLQIYSLRNGSLETLLFHPNWEKACFHHESDDVKLRRDSIFKGQFVFDKTWRTS